MTAGIAGVSTDPGLARRAEQGDPSVLREVASQFEALFIEMMLKNMRSAELSDSMLGASDQQKMYQEMMDQQLAHEMSSGRGLGLADMLVRQLGGESQPVTPTAEVFAGPVNVRDATRSRVAEHLAVAERLEVARHENATERLAGNWASPEEFIRDLWPHAERVAKRLNVAPEGVLAQAALETGWGKHVMQGSNGASSHNLFGIKAGGDWSGGSVAHRTVEYVDGVGEKRTEHFRAYADLSQTFDDYANLIEGNARYAAVQGTGSDGAAFGRALQEAGYATDPLYAAKIARVLGSDTMQTAVSALKVQ